VHESQAIRVPAELPPEQTCLLGCAIATGVGAVLETTPVWPGARVAVIGCGGVGLAAVQGARIAGAAEIVAVDLADEKLEQARRLGATEAVTALPDDVRVDFAFDAVGRPETFTAALAALDHGGVATLVGIPRAGMELRYDLARLFDVRAQIRVSHGGDHLPAEDLPRLAEHALSGALDLGAMVTRTIPFDDRIVDELAAVGSTRAVRTVVVF
jgi:Zn-dependent alcohol dehydrogenase